MFDQKCYVCWVSILILCWQRNFVVSLVGEQQFQSAAVFVQVNHQVNSEYQCVTYVNSTSILIVSAMSTFVCERDVRQRQTKCCEVNLAVARRSKRNFFCDFRCNKK